jgi:hypothetical protein
MPDKIQPYRQPMVTATGIYLGFVLNFSSSWVVKAFTGNRGSEIIIALGLVCSIALLLIVLFRILNMNYPKERAESYYKKTLICFITGIAISFLSILVVLFESFIINK